MEKKIKNFNISSYSWKANVDYRRNPDQYRIGKGEQGVLLCEPYKSEILPYWKFKSPEEAKKSAQKIYKLFLSYLKDNDFIGSDMARKFLQMGFTRARRYANYKGGRKYDDSGEILEKGSGDPVKAISATIFYEKWQMAENNNKYKKWKKSWKKEFG